MTKHAVSDDSLSLLLFSLRSGKLMAINLLKVSEIIPCPALTRLPDSHPHVKGITTLRGASLSVIDLSRAIGEQPLADPNGGCLIVTEISRSKQALHVQNVAKIIHSRSSDILPPPYGSGTRSFVTGVTQVEGQLVQVLDIEKVIHGIAPEPIPCEPSALSDNEATALTMARVLIVDDSQVALNQSLFTLQALNIRCQTARSAQEAIEKLLELQGSDNEINVVVSDIEMPGMDGYAFTQSLRESPDFSGIYVLLHTSLDSSMNSEKAKRAGANDVLTKFSPPELTRCVIRAAQAVQA
ncbi:two-component system chemotaxis response regulator CheV [Pseudomonas duriflava]|uniref:Two-component system chemotaxis response regulator CheV n=1 Tax=Pseudomonas duriflava TaxID=459528 RepID=A0A562QE08_9PSED|nr:chemotaxis protein [Pseudomonas duriflava]TWI55005.1 two-component system chemotaxis response regulator CheV [Pseudomonas duriflava]